MTLSKRNQKIIDKIKNFPEDRKQEQIDRISETLEKAKKNAEMWENTDAEEQMMTEEEVQERLEESQRKIEQRTEMLNQLKS